LAAPDPRVALLLVTVGDLSGSGGTERQFAGLFDYLRTRRAGRVSMITAASSLKRLQQAGHVQDGQGVVTLSLGDRPASTKPGIAWMTVLLIWRTLFRGYDIVHICQPTPSYVPYAAVLTRLPRAWRPAVVLTVVDCTLTPNLIAGSAADRYERQVVDAHRRYVRATALDGVFSWYSAFVEYSRAHHWFSGAVIKPARFCFSDPRRFEPGRKQPAIVFAGRLSEQKRPLLFVDAAADLLERDPQLVEGWRFEMYGRGPLEDAVRRRIAERGIGERLTLTHAIDMAPVFAGSRLFVSTQAHENFTSLAMLEAMAAGNAIVAENVGQSSEFVQPGNGILVTPATPAAFADGIAAYLREPARHDAMAAESRRLATEVHTVEHFAADIDAFWRDVAAS
jgi:glycosyltransferase involved in cell wall biosynthesis